MNNFWFLRRFLKAFENSSPSPVKFLVWHGFHWVARTCTTAAYRWLFRDSRPTLRILCSAVIKSPYFSARRIDVNMNIVRSFRRMCEHIRLQVLLINCEGLIPNKNALRWIFLVHLVCCGSSWLARHDLSASVSRVHDCHFESWLDLIMFSIFWNNWTDPSISVDVEDKMLLEYDDNLDTTRGTELSIVQVFVFPFLASCWVSPFSTQMNIRVLSKAYEAIESLAFHREIALLRTDGDHEQKLVLTLLFALSQVAVSRMWSVGPSQSIHCIWAHFSLLNIVHGSSRIHNKHTIFCVSGAFTRE